MLFVQALLDLWKAKKIKAVGVSNFNIDELQEIIDAKLELPAVNQYGASLPFSVNWGCISVLGSEHLLTIASGAIDARCPFNSHLYSPQKDLLDFCTKHKIVFNSYSPLGIPDWHKYPSTISTTGILIEEPALKTIGAAHGLTAAQVLLAWQWSYGMVSNPRTFNVSHMQENMAPEVFSTKFSEDEMRQLEGFKADECTDSNKWYECCGSDSVQPSIPKC